MKYWLSVALFFATSSVWACDACSGTGGSSISGQLLQNNESYIGLLNLYERHIYIDNESPLSKDYLSLYQVSIFGAYSFKDKWQVGTSIPYLSMHYKYDRREPINSIGDMTLFVAYKLYQTSALKLKTGRHIVYLQQGLKLPSGSLGKKNMLNESSFSSGSIDFLQSIRYIFEKKDKGLNTELNIQWNTRNKDQYRYGNRFNLTTYFYWKFPKDKVDIMPLGGLTIEYIAKDYSNKYIRNLSGGKSINSLFGLQVAIKDKYILTLNQNIAIAQKYLNADGNNERKNRINFSTLIKF
ncbi:MAG: hypothetical protein ACPG4Z_06875 [Chitinophagales bacterium]